MLQFVVGPFGCNNADAQFPGKYTDGRQCIALLEHSGQDLTFDLRHDLLIDRFITGMTDIKKSNPDGLLFYVFILYIIIIYRYIRMSIKMHFSLLFLFFFHYN